MRRKRTKEEQYYEELRKLGVFCGECHNHINWPVQAETLKKFLKDAGMDYIALCQGWITNPKQSRGHSGAKLAKYLHSLSDSRVNIRMGAEFPKTRFGHVCWWHFPSISDPFGVYMNYHDCEYFKRAGITDEKIEHPSDEFPYQNEAPLSKVARWKKEGGISMSPHPTSWWQENKKANLICTNISVDFCFDLFTHRLYDTLVVMGYDAEQIFYQNFWFRLLNMGYKINACAETDGSLKVHHRIGSLRTYAYTRSKKFNERKFLSAIKNGNSFLTSGPAIFAKTDHSSIPGDIIITNGEEKTIHFDARSAPSENEFISWIVIYKNGKPVKIIDIERDKVKRYTDSYSFKTPKGSDFAWYIIKVYGSTRPAKREFLNIMTYCELCEKETHDEYKEISQLAITNPFYFYGEKFKTPEPSMPKLNLTVVDEKFSPLPEVRIRIMDINSERNFFSDKNGKLFLNRISPLSEFSLEKEGFQTELLSIYLDYPPLKRYFENIYSGKWAFKNKNLRPGQVPFTIFAIENLKKILQEVNWKIILKRSKQG